MPISSSDIAGQIGMFQQQQMMFAQNGSLITESIQRTMDPSSGANWAAGRAINTGMAAAAPIAGLGLGLMGLDPLGGGIRMGMAAGAKWGVGAGIAAGGVAAGALGAVGMAGSFAVGQMHQGAMQQQQFNQGIRGSFNFLTPMGQGFTNQQMGLMSNQLRSMSGQVGQHGEMMGFGELSSMAANMGRMGMGNGIRDVQEFGRRFKEMVQTASQMARELGTTLEGAQQQMAQMKNSGVFKASDQMRMSSEMRTYSLGGNVSMAALNNMAGVGSQISRMVGGRGRAGAFAGIRTLGQVGMAVESGVLSEEDIYNATGLTGEEGKQAYASSQLQNSASWLRGGRGRRFLASIAGANGKLDARSVEGWMSGDMTTGSTMSQAYKNLGNVGRADFIRNEGRLRGEALAQFGGNIPAMALMQWAGGRGIDINNMDDRSMIFAQRQLGMGQDELEAAVKMIRDAPSIKSQARTTQAMDARRMEVAGVRKTTGLEGVKRNLEHTREAVQNKLQQAGAQMYSDLTEYIEDTINKMSGTILQQASADIDKSYQGLLKGDKASAAKLGIGTDSKLMKSLGVGGSLSGNSGLNAQTFDAKLPFGTSMRDRVTASGFGSFFSKGGDFAAESKRLEAAARGMGNLGDRDAMALGQTLSKELSTGYAAGIGGAGGTGISELKGAERMGAVRKLLRNTNTAEARQLLEKLNGSDTEGAYAALASAEAGMGLAEGSRIGAVSNLPGGMGVLSGSGMTQNERIRRYGEIAAGQGAGRSATVDRERKITGGVIGGSLGTMAALAAGPIGAGFALAAGALGATQGAAIGKVGGYLKDKAAGLFGIVTDGQRSTDYGNYLASKEGLAMTRSILDGGDMSRNLTDQINAIQDGGSAEKLQRDRLRGMLAGNNLLQEARKQGIDVDKLDAKQIKAIEDKAGAASGSAMNFLKAGAQASYDQSMIDRRESLMTFGKAALGETQRGQAIGYLDAKGELTGDAWKKVQKKAGAGGAALIDAMNNLRNMKGKGAQVGLSDAETLSIGEDLKGAGKSLEDAMYGSSIADLRKAADAQREMGDYAGAEQLSMMAGSRARGERTIKQAGNIGVARMLGLKVGGKDAVSLMGKGDGRLAAYLGAQFGVGTEAGIGSELEALGKKGNLTEQDKARKAELESQMGMAKQFAAIDKEKDVAKKNRLIDELRADPAFQKKEEERQKKTEQNDPSLRLLHGIKDELVKSSNALVDIAGRIGPTGGDGTVPQPGAKPGKGPNG